MTLLLGAAWASPVTLIGLCIGLLAMPWGVRWRRMGPMLVVNRFPVGPGGAMTLGQVVLHTGHCLDRRVSSYRACLVDSEHVAEQVSLAAHERAHVYQYFLLGPLFLPLYLLCGGISHRNPFEQAADRYARLGHGWWPWNSGR